MGYGDEVVAAGQAQALYDADPSKRIGIYGLDGQPRWHPIWESNPIIATPVDIAQGEAVQRLENGPNLRPYIKNPFADTEGWIFNRRFRCRDYPARIYLTAAERQRGDDARARYGSYVLIEPHTKHGNFRWPLARWAELVAVCPDMTFVQHTHRESDLVPGAHYEAATFREACGLVAQADCYVRSESGMSHAAAAFGVWQVTIFGGCMDPLVMGGYPHQAMITDTTPESPCGRWLPCTHCREVMGRITVEMVATVLRASLAVRKVAA